MSQEKKGIEPIDILNKSRARYLTSLQKVLCEVGQMCQQQNPNPDEMKAALKTAENRWADLDRTYGEMLHLLDHIPED